MGGESARAVIGIHGYELGAEYVTVYRRHNAEERTGHGRRNDRPDRLRHAPSRKIDQRPFHGDDEGVESKQVTNARFVEYEHGDAVPTRCVVVSGKILA